MATNIADRLLGTPFNGEQVELNPGIVGHTTLSLSVVYDKEIGAFEVRQDFSQVTSPDDYIIKEGVDDFREKMRPELSPALTTAAFSGIIETRRGLSGYRYPDRGTYVPKPMPGAFARSRLEIGIPEHIYVNDRSNLQNKLWLTIRYALMAGSTVEAIQPLRDFKEAGYADRLTRTELAMVALSEQLTANFGQS